MQKTKIEYLDMTWNPIAMRCTPVSEGCSNCWHLRQTRRFVGMDSFHNDVQMAYHGGAPVINTKELSAPLRRKKPACIGVQFMGDLFNESIPFEWIAAVYGVMAACQQHTFFVLSKRIDRMSEYYAWVSKREQQGRNLFPHDDAGWRIRQMLTVTSMNHGANMPPHHGGPWPLPNVLPGCSVENQKCADERIPQLLQVPATERWVSYEPALSEVDFGKYYLQQKIGCKQYPFGMLDEKHRTKNIDLIDLLVAGAETGPGARPCELDWLRSARDQCAAAGVPFFLKQINAAGDRELDGRMHEEMM